MADGFLVRMIFTSGCIRMQIAVRTQVYARRLQAGIPEGNFGNLQMFAARVGSQAAGSTPRLSAVRVTGTAVAEAET